MGCPSSLRCVELSQHWVTTILEDLVFQWSMLGAFFFPAIPLCTPCTRKWLNILLWWHTFVRKITFNGRAMLTFRHHHFGKTFLSFVPHVPNKPKKEVQTTLFRVQKRFSITRSWLPKCSICTPSKKTTGTLHVFFLAKIPEHDQKKRMQTVQHSQLIFVFFGSWHPSSVGRNCQLCHGVCPISSWWICTTGGCGKPAESSIGLQSFSFNYTSKRIILED